MSLLEILVVAEQQGLVHPFRQMKGNLNQQKLYKYCCFHRDRGHVMQDSHHLYNEIEKFIHRLYLAEFVDKSGEECWDTKTMYDFYSNRSN